MKPTRPEVTITLGGERHKLVLDFNALAAFETKTGMDFGEAMSKHGRSAKTIRALLWAGILHETCDEDGEPTKRTPSIGTVGRLISIENLKDTLVSVQAAYSAASGKPDKDEAEETDRPTDQTGDGTGTS
jgi:hypothetical protein